MIVEIFFLFFFISFFYRILFFWFCDSWLDKKKIGKVVVVSRVYDSWYDVFMVFYIFVDCFLSIRKYVW